MDTKVGYPRSTFNWISFNIFPSKRARRHQCSTVLISCLTVLAIVLLCKQVSRIWSSHDVSHLFPKCQFRAVPSSGVYTEGIYSGAKHAPRPACGDFPRGLTASNGVVYFSNRTLAGQCEGFRIESNGIQSLGILRSGQKVAGSLVGVRCGQHTTVFSNVQRNRTLIREKLKTRNTMPHLGNKTPFNVVVLALPRTSSPGGLYMLRDAVRYFEDEMNGIFFDNYNAISADFLKNAEAVFCSGRDIGSKSLIDMFASNGYLTVLAEQGQYFQMLSSCKPNIDFNLHDVDQFLDYDGNCIGHKPDASFNLEFLRSIISTYPDQPKFLVTVFKTTHQNPQNLQHSSGNILDFLRFLNSDQSTKERTAVVIIGVNGPRTRHRLRNYEEAFEERHPVLGISLPRTFQREFPAAYQSLRENTKRLVTPMDVHLTFVNMTGSINNMRPVGESLFQLIPASRDCSTAGINRYMCGCMLEHKQWLLHRLATEPAQITANYLNHLISIHSTSACSNVQLSTVLSSTLYSIPGQQFLSETSDFYSFTEFQKFMPLYVRVVFKTLPNNAIIMAEVDVDQYIDGIAEFALGPRMLTLLNVGNELCGLQKLINSSRLFAKNSL